MEKPKGPPQIIKLILAVYDRRVAVYEDPIFVIHEGHAMRWFEDQCTDPKEQTAISRHPQDFDLMRLGIINTTTAEVLWEDTPVQIMTGLNYVKH